MVGEHTPGDRGARRREDHKYAHYRLGRR
jgi:hypothetical protein